MGIHVGGLLGTLGVQMLLDNICLRSQFTLIILVSVCYHPYVFKELGFINMNMPPTLAVATAA